LFGTDGIRGRAGEGWLTPAKVSALGRAAGEVLREQPGRARKQPRALLGHERPPSRAGSPPSATRPRAPGYSPRRASRSSAASRSST
jgi:hypothetical protein